jgi:hypothetical protein
MELLFAFHYDKNIVCVNLYKVSIVFTSWGVLIAEVGCDHPASWDIINEYDIAVLRSWAIGHMLNGELFMENK